MCMIRSTPSITSSSFPSGNIVNPCLNCNAAFPFVSLRSSSYLHSQLCTANLVTFLSLWARSIGLFEFGSRFPTSSIIHFNLRKWWASSLFSCYRRRFTVLHNLRSEAGSLGFDVFLLRPFWFEFQLLSYLWLQTRAS